MAFRWVSVLPLLLIFIFGAIAIRDRMGGGYRVVHITEAIGEKPPAEVPAPSA